MQSVQLLGCANAVHSVGITEAGVLYVDIQRFAPDGSDDATTYYVRAADVQSVKHLASEGRPSLLTDAELVDLFAASFHTADYALEWLRWARVPTVRRHDAHAQYNAEMHVPLEAQTALPVFRHANT